MNTTQKLQMCDIMNRQDIYNTLLSKFNAYYNDGSVTELILDFSGFGFFCVDSLILCLRALLVGAGFLRKNQSSFRITIIEGKSDGFYFLFHTGFFSALSNYCTLEDEQINRIYFYQKKQFNPENVILSFDKFKKYADLIKSHNPEKWRDFSYEQMKEDKDARNELASIITWEINHGYINTYGSIEDYYGGRYADTLKATIIELVSNAIIHSDTISYLFFERGCILPTLKSMQRIKDEEIKGIFISVGDIGIGLQDSLQKKTELTEYRTKFYAIKDDLSRKYSSYALQKSQRQELSDAWIIFEALFYSAYKEEQKHYEGLYNLVKQVTQWNGIVSFSYGNVDLAITRLSGFYEFFDYFIYRICKNTYSNSVRTHNKRIKGLQIDIEIPTGGKQ